MGFGYLVQPRGELMVNDNDLGLSALEALPSAIVITDDKRIIRIANAQAGRLLGKRVDELIGVHLTEIPGLKEWRTPEEQIAFYEQDYDPLGPPRELHIRYDGMWIAKTNNRWLEFRSEPIWKAANTLLGIVFQIFNRSYTQFRTIEPLPGDDQRQSQAHLIDLLKNSDDDLDREDSAKALGEMGDDTAIVPLLNALRDPVDTVRWTAAMALTNFGLSVVEPLLQLLDDSSADVRGQAALVLGNIQQDERALPKLLKMIDEDNGLMLNGVPVAGIAQYAVTRIQNATSSQ